MHKSFGVGMCLTGVLEKMSGVRVSLNTYQMQETNCTAVYKTIRLVSNVSSRRSFCSRSQQLLCKQWNYTVDRICIYITELVLRRVVELTQTHLFSHFCIKLQIKLGG